MSTGILTLIIGSLAFIGLMSALVGMFGSRIRVADRLEHASAGAAPRSGVQEWIGRATGVVRPLGEFVPRSPEEMSRQERKLVRAGIRGKDAVFLFYGLQIAVLVALALIFLVTGLLSQNPILYLLLAVLGGAALPDLWLARRTANRQMAIQHGLPDVMDLAVISMEAGLGLDQTLMRVGQEFENVHPEISEEFRLHNLEKNLGRSRVEAFRSLADRTGVEDLKALVAVLIQTDRFGTSIADALRIYSDTLRTKRRQRAEEAAAKLPVKMIFPMILFIFPGVGVVILGPALISVMDNLLPALSGAGG